MNTKIFDDIAGYDDVKKELLMIQSWIKDEEIISNPNVKLPRGILFYGEPGNGKTLFLKRYSKSFNAPIVVIEGSENNTCNEIHKAFKKTKEYPFSILIIDEIDLLIQRRSDIERTLQAELDGVNSKGNLLVLATTNNLYSLDDALLRSGRFDRVIHIDNPDRESRRALFELYSNKLNLKNIDFDYLSKISYGVCGADISAILNDAFLRRKEEVTTDDVEESYYRIDKKVLGTNSTLSESHINPEIAYHEVAHALMCYKYKDDYTFFRASFDDNGKGGVCRMFPVDENKSDSDSIFKHIEIDLAGYVITKLKFKRLDSGCVSDLQNAREKAVKIVNKLGLNGADKVLPFYDCRERMETEGKKGKNEKVIESIIKKAEKSVRKYLKSNLKCIDRLAQTMMIKGHLKADDLIKIVKNF